MLSSKKYYPIATVAALFLVLQWSGCMKNPPEYPVEPAITFKSVSSKTINEFDTIRYIVNFTDGDADIGQKETSKPTFNSQPCDLYSDTSAFKDPHWTLILLDHRDSCLELKTLPYIEASGKVKSISGEIEFATSFLACKVRNCSPAPGCPDDTLVYTIFVKDRAGNLSNGLVTPPVIINCN